MAEEITFKREELGDGVVYEGELDNEGRFVYGKYSCPGLTYIGEFNQNSDIEGMGKLTVETENGQIVYVGTFKGAAQNGLPQLNGYGAIHYFLNVALPEEFKGMAGIKYEEGKFVNSSLHGQGTIHYEDGGKYEGEFDHGRMHGKGIKTDADGTITSREYNNGKVKLPDGLV